MSKSNYNKNNNKTNYKSTNKSTNKNKNTKKIEKEEVKEETTKEVEDIKEIDDSFKDEIKIEKKTTKTKNSPLIGFLSFVLFIIGVLYFIGNLFFNNSNDNNLFILVNSLLLILFTFSYIISSITHNRKINVFGYLLLIGYFSFNSLINAGYISFNTFNKVEDLSNRNLSEVIKWASKNKITIDEEYEYSDMVDKYNIISQSVKAGTNIKDIDSITVAVSDGPNPSKNVIIPNMVTWDVERVTNFVLDNHLSNVDVEFVSSESKEDTVIEQSYTGNMNRDEYLKLTFSYGEELGYEEVKLIDFTDKTSFEAMLFCRQHLANFEFKDGFSNKIKKGNIYKQSVKAGETVSINSDPITIYISKGPKVVVPDFSKYSLEEITNWVIKNRLKIRISDKYDDSIKENNVVSTSYNKGDVLSQGDTIEVVISRGPLKMRKFKSLDDFRDWADKNNIKYEIQYEFSTDTEPGKVISYSYKPGESIKNDDSIIVKVSTGKKVEVPNLKGLTKNEAIKKLKAVGLNYNFVTKSSDSVKEGEVMAQSMSAGSEVGKNSTITVTISSGKSTVQKKESSNNTNKNNSSNKNSNTNNNSNSNSNNNNNQNNNPAPAPDPTPTCNTCKVGRDINNIFSTYSSFNEVRSALNSYFSSKCPGISVSVVGVESAGSSGGYVGGISPGDTLSSCGGPYSIQIAK